MHGMNWKVPFGYLLWKIGMSKEEAMQKYIDCIEAQKVKYA